VSSRRPRILAALAVLVAACSSAPDGPEAPRGPSVDLLVRMPDDRSMRYHVDRSGVLSFAGGEDAAPGRFTWSRPLTDEERRDLARLLEEDWSGPGPEARGDTAGPRYDVEIEGLGSTGGAKRLKLRGLSPEAERLRGLLDGLASARHATFLERLPKAGEQRP
jgi:hypothetical protein